MVLVCCGESLSLLHPEFGPSPCSDNVDRCGVNVAQRRS